jgi:DNA polymerase III subunit delta'
VSRAGEEAGEVEFPHPRTTSLLIGHAAGERTLLDAYRSSRVPHAWLIGGPPGIGKATLAYRLARFVLAQPDPSNVAVRYAETLAVDPQHPVFRRVAAQAHADLLVLERTAGDSGALRAFITVDQVARTAALFGSTAGEGGWRVCIVDSADELNSASANKLLKVLEEPPARSLLLLVSHAPGRLLPTIRSRCCHLSLRPLAPDEVVRAAAAAAGRSERDPEIRAAAAVAEGSVGRALSFLCGTTLALRDRVSELLERLPALDQRALHALGDTLAGTDPAPLATFMDAVRAWLSARLAALPQEARELAPVAEVWEKVNRAGKDVEVYNLERKPLVFAVFGLLADTARR